MHPSEVRQKCVKNAAGRDMGNLGIESARFAWAQAELLLHFFEKHLNRPTRGEDLHHGNKGQRGVRRQKHAPLFLIREATHIQFHVPDIVVAHHDLIIAGVEFAATQRWAVPTFFRVARRALAFTLFSW